MQKLERPEDLLRWRYRQLWTPVLLTAGPFLQTACLSEYFITAAEMKLEHLLWVGYGFWPASGGDTVINTQKATGANHGPDSHWRTSCVRKLSQRSRASAELLSKAGSELFKARLLCPNGTQLITAHLAPPPTEKLGQAWQSSLCWLPKMEKRRQNEWGVCRAIHLSVYKKILEWGPGDVV